MMTNAQYLLGKLAEEASEISQIALKTQQFGFEEKHPDLPDTNKERIHKELNDLLAIVQMLNVECGFDFKQNEDKISQKVTKVDYYRNYSRNLGETK